MSSAPPLALSLSLSLVLACSRPSSRDQVHAPQDPSVTVTAVPPPSPSPKARLLFCAFGGVGLVPSPLPPGYETSFASVVVELDNPGAPLAGVALQALRLRELPGTGLASLRRVVHLVTLGELEPEGPTMGRFAVFLNPEGTPFDGVLPHGRTLLRARVSLDSSPAFFPAACEVELRGVPGTVTGKVDGSWPT